MGVKVVGADKVLFVVKVDFEFIVIVVVGQKGIGIGEQFVDFCDGLVVQFVKMDGVVHWFYDVGSGGAVGQCVQKNRFQF